MQYIGESRTGNPVRDFDDFEATTKRPSAHRQHLKFFYYVGKASKPKNGELIGPGSRQDDSFREHLPINDPNRIDRPNGGSCKIIAGGDIIFAASYFYEGLSEKAVDRLLIEHQGDELRLNMIATNGLAKSNCYVHIYAVSNAAAHWVVHPPQAPWGDFFSTD